MHTSMTCKNIAAVLLCINNRSSEQQLFRHPARSILPMNSYHRLISSGSVHMSIHTITYVLFTKNLFSEPCKNLAPRSKSAKFEPSSSVLLNKSFSSTYNFSVEFSKTFDKTALLI